MPPQADSSLTELCREGFSLGIFEGLGGVISKTNKKPFPPRTRKWQIFVVWPAPGARETPLNGPGSSCSFFSVEDQPRRPILKPFRDIFPFFFQFFLIFLFSHIFFRFFHRFLAFSRFQATSKSDPFRRSQLLTFSRV